jgi:hypothetical protein
MVGVNSFSWWRLDAFAWEPLAVSGSAVVQFDGWLSIFWDEVAWAELDAGL